MFQTNEATTDTISNTSWPKTEDEIDSYIYSLLEKCNKVDEYDEKAHQLYKQKLIERVTQRRQQQSNQQKQSSANQPHCPTCGSTDIIKISAAKKAMGAGLFGLFSKTAKSQFECKNCGYKW
ncbi:hypothetical protein DXB71_17720 [Blautia sp. OM05-6]|nr:hypothetical protein DXB71_17720 [Blautia sp. OM05-6]